MASDCARILCLFPSRLLCASSHFKRLASNSSTPLPSPNMSDGDVQALVVDNGSGMCKVRGTTTADSNAADSSRQTDSDWPSGCAQSTSQPSQLVSPSQHPSSSSRGLFERQRHATIPTALPTQRQSPAPSDPLRPALDRPLLGLGCSPSLTPRSYPLFVPLNCVPPSSPLGRFRWR